jgi:hypothetical protein
MAHCRDGGRPSWRPVVEVVPPPLWHQGHTLCPELEAIPRNAPGFAGGRTDGLLTRSGGFGIALGRAGLFGASEMRRAPWWGRRPRRPAAWRPGLLGTSAAVVAPAVPQDRRSPASHLSWRWPSRGGLFGWGPS